MSKRVWMYNPKSSNILIPENVKVEIMRECEKFIQEKLKPKYLKPLDKENKKEMQLVDIYAKMMGNRVLFNAKYKDFRPSAPVEDFEEKFARITAGKNEKFFLDYMRHTGKWSDISFPAGDSLEDCLKEIEEFPHFMP